MNYSNDNSSQIKTISIFLVILMALLIGCGQNIAAKKAIETCHESKLISEIRISEDSKSFNILIKGNRMLTYTSVKQPFPLAVIFYFPETALDNIKKNILPESEIVASIIASKLTEKENKAKIKILLKKDVLYKTANEGNDLKISFSKLSKTLSSSEPLGENDKTKYKKPAWVSRIDFLSKEAGKSTIIIGTTNPIEFSIKKASNQLLQIKLLNTRLPDSRKLPLINTQFESAIDRIVPIQMPAMYNLVMLTIELREPVPYFIEQNESLLLIHFEASSISTRPLEETKFPSLKKTLAQTAYKEKIKIDEKYTGEKITLDFYETDVKNVFRILKEIGGKNFVIDKDVVGKVTLSLDKPVPWDQVLDLVLKMNQLGKVVEEDIIRIATAETLKKEEIKYKDLLKAKEEKKALEPLETAYIAVNYANAKEDILPKIEAILTENRGSVSADERTNIIIVTDVPAKIEQARKIVMNLDTVTPQVIIEARIVEATTNFSREIGTQWGAARGVQPSDNIDTSAMGTWITDKALEAQRSLDQIGVGGNTYGGNMTINVPTVSSAMSIGFNFTKIAGIPFLLNAKLLAMESSGKGKIISAPKIVTLDNKTATIQQGLRYPYTVTDEAGNSTTKLENIDLVLEVTPHVTSDNRIIMKIAITKADLGLEYIAGRSFTTKKAKTELLVDDGNTVVIGGIIKTIQTSTDKGVPGLSKIPLIGWLFKSTDKSDDKEELLIFITPKIVKLEQRNLSI